MYFDKFEEELAGVVQEPQSDSYEEPGGDLDMGDEELPPEEPEEEI